MVMMSIQRRSSSSSEGDEPQPSTSGEPPAKVLRRHPPHRSWQSSRVPTFFDFSSDDSDDERDHEWLPSTLEDAFDPCFDISSSEDELDSVSQATTTHDIDEPLSNVAAKMIKRNVPGTRRFAWKRKDNIPNLFSFQGSPGVKVKLDVSSTPLEIFSWFFTDDLLDLIVKETNWYAAAHPPCTSPKMRKWMPTSREELQAYFGIRVIMGLAGRPSYYDYWSSSPVLRHELVAEVMTRDRFDQLTACLHFAHVEEGAPLPEDRMWKLRPVVNALSNSFRSTFMPGQEITIDESLWKFHEKLDINTCNTSKRATFGLKVCKLCATTGPAAGYTSCFKVYIGQDRGDIPSSTKAVLHLMETGGFLGLGYQLFVDAWYTSPSLFRILQARNTNAAGRAQLNRKFMPKDLSVRGKGDVDYCSSNGLLALQWKGRDTFTLLSTIHTASMDGSKPSVVVDYNNSMKGFEFGDQMASYYQMSRHSKAWYRKIFFYLFDLAIVNAWAVHRALGGGESQKTFRSDLAKELLGDFREGADSTRHCTATRPPVAVRQALQQRRHAVTEIPDGKRRRCRWCSEQGQRKNTRSFCPDCNVGLCTYGCFEAWHTDE
ncbi:piggyBac transposable element-derived protein 4 [Penaeus vannamei]|uniref:piggyBac transposable element-derived protein 4 n=1 Tax=Penaeus vannamei TaxID=6689 RepID=UPI000F688142|nr:piggyBac transposable element-derived protein 4-like [Penaeus vannamei]XP_027232578.1 piggyBac transposable element-derived protein 4-like [Penaeus vannamei]